MIQHGLRKIVTFLIIFSMVFGMIPWQDIKAYAFDADKYYVDNITITKIYNGGGYAVSQTKVTIRGRFLQNVSVGTMTSTGYKVLKNPDPNLDTVQEFLVDGDIVGSSMDVGNVTIPIIQNELPTLLSISTRSIRIGTDDLTLNGSFFLKIRDSLPSSLDGNYSAYYENTSGAGGQIVIEKPNFTENNIATIPTAQLLGVAGLQNIVLKKEKIEKVNFLNNNPGERDVNITIQNTYVNQFRLVDKISVTNLVMNPNRGQPGDIITFMGTAGLDNYDVFFLKNLSDKFTEDNKGRNTSFTPNIDDKQVLTTQVPPFKLGAIENGEYYVVLTNKVPVGKNPNDEVNKQLILGVAPNYEKFTVIDSKQKIKIFSVQPNKGPDTGSKVEVSGVFFGSLNIPEYIPADNTKVVTTVTNSNDTVMEISYTGGTYKGFNVTSAKRTVKVVIGSIARFAKKPNSNEYEFTFSNELDKMSLITPSISDAETNPLKDVVVETETTFMVTGFPNNIIIKDRAELKQGYTFVPSKVTPVVTDITPQKIQVNRIDSSNYYIPEDRMIAIHGNSFMVHKYTNGQGQEVVRYPIVELGNNIILNKNNGNLDRDPNPDLYLKVFDKLGKEVDGTEGNELGDKILVIIPEGKSLTTLGKTYLKVTNPVRNAETEGLSGQKLDVVEFVHVTDKPVIESVDPSIVTTEGKVGVTVTGNNFQEGVKVFIDGKEIPGVTRDISAQANKMLLKFQIPPGREGTTQLQVMNPDGGIALWEFTYVKTFNKDPKLNTFSPNKGSSGTLVVANGENFLKSDATTPNTSGLGIYRLIGTRVLLSGKEINSYYKVGNNIALKNYVSPLAESSKLIYKDLSNVKAADYYYSIILEDDVTGRFYTLDVDTKGNLILSDGITNTYTLIEPIVGQSDAFKALKGGNAHTIRYVRGNTIIPDKLSIDGTIELSIKTPYTTETKTMDGVTGEYITGNRVKVINKNQLTFTIPPMEVEKWYDLTVVNPDTRSSTKAGLQGFYYFKQPLKNPTITNINPPQGSTDGGYTAVITGTTFKDDGTDKTRVFIGGVEVPAADVTVSTDGTQLTFKVPKYPGDLQSEVETDKKTVPVVVVNSDGGSASRAEGFTYIIPTSHPKINKILPDKGSAAGGSIVQVFGSDFRYFEPYKDANNNVQYDLGEEFQNLNNNYENDMPKWDDLEGKPMELLSDMDKNILPKVYFGKLQAKVLEFADGYLVVETPSGVKGAADVYVVNNDYGISNKVKYTYEGSSPSVSAIVPKEGRKQGKDKIEINGMNFIKSKVDIYNSQIDGSGNTIFDTRDMALLRFGDAKNANISNHEINVDLPNGGRVIGKLAKVIVNDLTVDYNADLQTLTLTVKEDAKEYKRVIQGYDDSTKYIMINSLKSGEESHKGYEMVRVAVDAQARKLMVERGYAPFDVNNSYRSTQLILYTPSYYTIGKVPVTIINPDGGQAKTEFEYKNPDSIPRITNITKEGRIPVLLEGVRVVEVTYKGGNIISILGSDFRDKARIQISNVLSLQSDKIQYDSLPGKLTFTMPAVPETAVGQLHRVVVINEDGGIAASDEALPIAIYIKFIKGETSPAIEKVTPDKGPSSGGTRVVITGKDFRQMDGQKPSVYFGEVQATDVTLVDYKTIIVHTPSHAPGKVNVKVENPDGELASPQGSYTYLSTPTIIAVVDPTDPNENARIRAISVEGQQLIKLKGSNFMTGARVLFASTVKPLNSGATPKGELIYINGQPYDLEGGKLGSEVTLINEETLTVKTPQGKLDSKGVIVVNPDGGASNLYEDLKYGLPELLSPTGVTAELAYDRYIKIHWQGVTGATAYEIYVLAGSSTSREFIGSTALTSYVYHDLKPNTSYKFVVTALGNFGNSAPSLISNSVKTGSKVGPPDEDGGLNENTKIEKIGNRAFISMGSGDANKEITIDLTKGDLAGSQDLVISIPAAIIARTDTKNITIIGKDFRIKMNPNVFYNTKIKDNKSKSDAGVRLTLAPAATSNIGLGDTALSTQYEIKADLYIGKENSALDYLGSSFQVTMDVNLAKTDLQKFKTISFSRYEGQDQTWMSLASGNQDSMAITALTNRLGKFTIIGRRR